MLNEISQPLLTVSRNISFGLPQISQLAYPFGRDTRPQLNAEATELITNELSTA